MLGIFSSKTKIEVGSLCEVQHPVSSIWVHGSVTKDEGDGYYAILVDSSEELLNHVHSKMIRKVRAPDRPIAASEKASSKSNNSSTKTEVRRFSIFGSKKVTEQAVAPVEETPKVVAPPVEEAPPVKIERKTSVKSLVAPPEDRYQKKIQRRKLDNEELVWLDRSRKCAQNGMKVLDLSKLHLEDTIPEMFTKDSYVTVPEVILRKNFFTTLSPLHIFQASVITLDVSYNLFAEAANIRESFTNLPQFLALRSLDLSGNMLEHLPTEIYTLSKLEKLTVKRNKLRDVPSAMVACANLTLLDISYNDLATIPSVFEEIKMLGDLNIDHNPCFENGLEGLDISNIGEKTIFLLEKRGMLKNREFRRGIVQHATKIQNAVLEKEKQRILSQQQDHGIHVDEFD